jgi:hypothetical protein
MIAEIARDRRDRTPIWDATCKRFGILVEGEGCQKDSRIAGIGN